MKKLRFICGEPVWSVPLEELSAGMKSMLHIQWSEFIRQLEDVECNVIDKGDPMVVATLERIFLKKDFRRC